MLGKPRHIGKESNKLDERIREELDAEGSYLNNVSPEDWSFFRQVVAPEGIELGDTAAIAEEAGVSRRVVQKAFAGHTVRPGTETAIADAVRTLRLRSDSPRRQDD